MSAGRELITGLSRSLWFGLSLIGVSGTVGGYEAALLFGVRAGSHSRSRPSWLGPEHSALAPWPTSTVNAAE
jgi:hypothetical protein